MPFYEIFGRAIESEMPLPELPAVSGVPAALRFERRRPEPAASPSGSAFVIAWRPDGDPWLRAHRTAAGYRLEYCNCATFDVDLERRAIAGDTIACTEEMFRHFFVDQIVPLAMSLETPVLHASSVAIDGRLVALAGPGGAGKSTLATALARRGHGIGGDDALLVEARGGAVTAVPAYPGVRLWGDSERAVASDCTGRGRTEPNAKQRFSKDLPFVRGASVLTGVYLLDWSSADAIAFDRISPRDATIELLRQTYRLALDDRAAMAREFEALTAVASRVPCWRLSFPRRLEAWQALAAEVEAHIRTQAHGPRTSGVGPRTSGVGLRTSDLGPRTPAVRA